MSVRSVATGIAAVPAWQWLLLALCDVEGNYLLVLAYQYTDITSVCVLDAFAIPATMALSRCFGARYPPRQLFAAATCLCGLAVLVANDLLHRNAAAAAAASASPAAAAAGAPPPSPAPQRPSSMAWLGDVLVHSGVSILRPLISHTRPALLSPRLLALTQRCANRGP